MLTLYPLIASQRRARNPARALDFSHLVTGWSQPAILPRSGHDPPESLSPPGRAAPDAWQAHADPRTADGEPRHHRPALTDRGGAPAHPRRPDVATRGRRADRGGCGGTRPDAPRSRPSPAPTERRRAGAGLAPGGTRSPRPGASRPRSIPPDRRAALPSPACRETRSLERRGRGRCPPVNPHGGYGGLLRMRGPGRGRRGEQLTCCSASGRANSANSSRPAWGSFSHTPQTCASAHCLK